MLSSKRSRNFALKYSITCSYLEFTTKGGTKIFLELLAPKTRVASMYDLSLENTGYDATV